MGSKHRSEKGDAHRRHARNAGFTLVELLVVLAILALIAALVAPRVIGYLGTSNVKAAGIQLSNIEAALDLYRLDTGRYPDRLEALIVKPEGASNWNGPYFKKASALDDPWGRRFQYVLPGQHGEYDLMSLGADGAEGGDDENRDIHNW